MKKHNIDLIISKFKTELTKKNVNFDQDIIKNILSAALTPSKEYKRFYSHPEFVSLESIYIKDPDFVLVDKIGIHILGFEDTIQFIDNKIKQSSPFLCFYLLIKNNNIPFSFTQSLKESYQSVEKFTLQEDIIKLNEFKNFENDLIYDEDLPIKELFQIDLSKFKYENNNINTQVFYFGYNKNQELYQKRHKIFTYIDTIVDKINKDNTHNSKYVLVSIDKDRDYKPIEIKNEDEYDIYSLLKFIHYFYNIGELPIYQDDTLYEKIRCLSIFKKQFSEKLYLKIEKMFRDYFKGEPTDYNEFERYYIPPVFHKEDKFYFYSFFVLLQKNEHNTYIVDKILN